MQRSKFFVETKLSFNTIKAISGFILVLFFGLILMSFKTDGNFNIGFLTEGDTSGSLQASINHLHSDPVESVEIELNPHMAPYVEKFIKREADDLNELKGRSKPYFDLYDKILANYNLPLQLKYLSVIESNLHTSIVSPAGAVGAWQLMPQRARHLGLIVNKKTDDRKNLLKSTNAAAKALKNLYNTFGDWLLVIAAYNAGEGRVQQAIRKAGSKDYWDLKEYLPAQTRGHVKRYIATHYFFEGGGGLTTMSRNETKDYMEDVAIAKAKASITPEEKENTLVIDIQGKFKSVVIAENIQMDIASFNHLNPGLEKTLEEDGMYSLRLPKEKVRLFRERKQYIKKESKRDFFPQTVEEPIAGNI